MDFQICISRITFSSDLYTMYTAHWVSPFEYLVIISEFIQENRLDYTFPPKGSPLPPQSSSSHETWLFQLLKPETWICPHVSWSLSLGDSTISYPKRLYFIITPRIQQILTSFTVPTIVQALILSFTDYFTTTLPFSSTVCCPDSSWHINQNPHRGLQAPHQDLKVLAFFLTVSPTLSLSLSLLQTPSLLTVPGTCRTSCHLQPFVLVLPFPSDSKAFPSDMCTHTHSLNCLIIYTHFSDILLTTLSPIYYPNTLINLCS